MHAYLMHAPHTHTYTPVTCTFPHLAVYALAYSSKDAFTKQAVTPTVCPDWCGRRLPYIVCSAAYMLTSVACLLAPSMQSLVRTSQTDLGPVLTQSCGQAYACGTTLLSVRRCGALRQRWWPSQLM